MKQNLLPGWHNISLWGAFQASTLHGIPGEIPAPGVPPVEHGGAALGVASVCGGRRGLTD